VENFCKWTKAYLDSKGPQHRLVFLVDEVGQFIGTDSHLMLNLQTITEELGTLCQRRAWVMVTSQEDMDSVLGELPKAKRHDFSKIQGRFFPPLSLSSANVDEVIQSRLLEKVPSAKGELARVFKDKGDILKNQLTFTNCGMTFRKINSTDEFVKNYPFVPYQFQLIQKVFEAIRKAGATGTHLAKGERSMLDAFQSAAKTIANQDVGVLVPLYEFYPSIEGFLDTTVKKTIEQASSNPSLEPFDIRLLQILFLIRYVDEMKGNIDNLVTLSIDEIDADRLALRRRIEASLARLEKETLISRNGENFFFLTNEERDITKEIKAVDLASGEEAKLLGEIIFEDVLKGHRKHRFSANKVDFAFNRLCDKFPIGSQPDGALLVSVISPVFDDYEGYTQARCVMESSLEGGYVLIRLANDDNLGRELRTHLQTDKYVAKKNDGTLPESIKRILRDCAEDNRQRRERLKASLAELLRDADFFVAGQPLKTKASSPDLAFADAMEYLIRNTFSKMSYLKHLTPDADRAKAIQAVLRSNDIAKQQLSYLKEEDNPEALDDIRKYVELCSLQNHALTLQDLVEKRYAGRPYGWPEEETLLLVARLLVLGEIGLAMDSQPLALEKVYEPIMTSAKRKKIGVSKRQTTGTAALQKARTLGKELFAQMGPDGEDALFSFLQLQLKDWHSNLTGFKPLADTGNYPGKDAVSEGISLIQKLLTDSESYKFIERFNSLADDLSEFADQYHHLDHFYNHQREIWDKLRKAKDRFNLNRLELEQDETAVHALQRMSTILKATAPYELIKEIEGLIGTVEKVNTALVEEKRSRALDILDERLARLTADVGAVKGDAALSGACLDPLQKLRQRLAREESLAHISQAEGEATKAFDAGISRIEEYSRRKHEDPPVVKASGSVVPPPPVVKKQRVIKPALLVGSPKYLETQEQVDDFLDSLRRELEKALAANERIEIR